MLVYVPGGVSIMGTDEGDEREKPPHEVQLSGFFVGKYEVSIAQFGSFVAARSYITTAERAGSSMVLGDTGQPEQRRATWRDPLGDGHAAPLDHPVAHVSWYDANAYVTWAGLALPTEAQWEKAGAWDPAKKKLRRYSWGDEAANALSKKVGNVMDEALKRKIPNLLCFDGYDDGYERASPVGAFPDGASAYGALDMTGNVVEWCADAYEEGFYKRSPRQDPVCTEGDQRCSRGGCFTYGPLHCRASRRGASNPEVTSENMGFRVALGE